MYFEYTFFSVFVRFFIVGGSLMPELDSGKDTSCALGMMEKRQNTVYGLVINAKYLRIFSK